MILSGKARLAGVIGWPVSHSRSPRLHNHWLSEHGIDGVYVPLPVHPNDLEQVLRALPKMGFAGVNLTVPHKEAALALMDRIDEKAQRMGAVNTVVIGQDGSLEGRNNDAFGFMENIRIHGGWRGGDDKIAVVIGAGGAARAVCVALIDDGIGKIRLCNRTIDRARALADDLGPKVEIVAWDDRAACLEGADLLVNTTTQGMIGQPALDLALDCLPAHALVNDIVYTPLQTPLLQAAKARSNLCVDGLGMLLYQAQPAFAAWFGVTPHVSQALRDVVMAG